MTNECANKNKPLDRSFLEETLTSSGVGTFVLDRDFTIVWVNQAIEDFFGIDADELTGRDKRTLIKSTLASRLEQPESFENRLLDDYDQNNHVDEFECHVLPGENRAERWLQHWSKPIEKGPYEGGRLEHYTDITRQKQIESKLRRSEERYRRIVENCPDGVFVFNRKGEFLEVNDAALELTGYTRSQLLSSTIFDLLPEKHRDQAHEHLSRATDGTQMHLEFPILTQEGDERFWIVEAARLSKDLIFSFAKDITRRREAENQLRKTEKQFRLMAEQSEAVIWLTDPEFAELLFINDRYEAIFGGSRQAVLEDPMNVLEDIHPGDHEPVKESIQKLTEGEKVELEYRIDSGSDFTHWAHAWGVPVEDNGEITYLLGSVRDITDRKHQEAKLKKVARTDELTDLPNRKALFEKLEDEVNRVQRYGGNLSLAILDVDNFKRINDRYGHLTGDEVLRRIADLLRNSTRDVDYAGRYGGEEFAIVFPETPLEQARNVTERIRRELEESVFTIEGQQLDPHWSGGVTNWRGDDTSVESLVGRADDALYEAKDRGRNRTVTK